MRAAASCWRAERRRCRSSFRVEKDGGVAEKEFIDGISVGMGKSLTYQVPVGVYQRFTVLAGLHPELGAKGRVAMTIKGDGRQLASLTFDGGQPARVLDCDIAGVKQIQLVAISAVPMPRATTRFGRSRCC